MSSARALVLHRIFELPFPAPNIQWPAEICWLTCCICNRPWFRIYMMGNLSLKPPPVPSLRVHLCGSQRGLSRTYWRPCSSGCWPTTLAGQSRVICESLIAARLQFWSSHCYLFSINSWEHYHLWKKLCCLMMFKSRKYANCSNFKIKTTPNNTQIGVYPEYYWNTEKATFKHKKISSSTFAFICQNNQIPSCDEN